MADGEVLVSDGEQSDSGDDLLRALPPWMPKDAASGNFKLIDAVGRAIDRLEADVEDVDNATTVQHAESIEQLEQLSRLVALPPQANESREKYRSRLIAEFQTMTTEATPSDVLENAATILDVDTTDIKYTRLDENGAISLGVPASALNALALSDQEFVEIIAKHSAAGYRIEATIKGTFTYTTPEKYNDNDMSGSRGYNGLDSNGEPRDNGGTYAGLIN